jgi:hypothetical protein
MLVNKNHDIPWFFRQKAINKNGARPQGIAKAWMAIHHPAFLGFPP